VSNYKPRQEDGSTESKTLEILRERETLMRTLECQNLVSIAIENVQHLQWIPIQTHIVCDLNTDAITHATESVALLNISMTLNTERTLKHIFTRPCPTIPSVSSLLLLSLFPPSPKSRPTSPRFCPVYHQSRPAFHTGSSWLPLDLIPPSPRSHPSFRLVSSLLPLSLIPP